MSVAGRRSTQVCVKNKNGDPVTASDHATLSTTQPKNKESIDVKRGTLQTPRELLKSTRVIKSEPTPRAVNKRMRAKSF